MTDNYYICLEIVDRISQEALKKFGNFSRFSKNCGYPRAWWYKTVDSGCGISYNTLVRVAKVLDLSAEYLLTGRQRKPYSDTTSIQHIARLKLGQRIGSLHTIKSRIKNGLSNDIYLTTLYNYADVTGLSPVSILRGEFR